MEETNSVIINIKIKSTALSAHEMAQNKFPTILGLRHIVIVQSS